jgi:hypothetical protein
MKHTTIPMLTTTAGILLGGVLVAAGATAPKGEQSLPLLMLLFMSEMGFIIALGGALYGIKLWQQQREKRFLLLNAAAGIVLALGLLIVGLNLWSTTNAG